jgi:hypothetical protein
MSVVTTDRGPPSEAARRQARRATQKRLARLQADIERARDRLIEIYSDRSGMARAVRANTLLGRTWSQPGSGILVRLERVTLAAANGCDLSRAFLAEWGDVVRLCQELRRTSPPAQAPDFDPVRERFWGLPELELMTHKSEENKEEK